MYNIEKRKHSKEFLWNEILNRLPSSKYHHTAREFFFVLSFPQTDKNVTQFAEFHAFNIFAK